MRTNQREDEIKPVHPKFLNIDNVRIKDLPDVAKEINEFNRVNREEWLPKKKDKRFRSKRKR